VARELQARAAQALADVRVMARGLRPSALDDLGLAAGLRRYASDLTRTQRLKIEIHTDDVTGDRLPTDIETALYRIAQEALTNVVKHAQATSVSVALSCDGDVMRMVIRDDGIGFAPSAPGTDDTGRGMGLESLNQRATLLGGRVDIESAPGCGTVVHVEIPAGRGHE
jgi:signal transduction histidine kinase